MSCQFCVFICLFLEMSEIMKSTKDGGIFLREMEPISEGESKQYAVFISATGKEILQQHKMWAGDGTFSSAPKMFSQVIVIIIILYY